VLIHGRKCFLNVSGGTNNGGWADYVRRVVHIGCGWRLASLRSLATVALSAPECRARGITLETEPLSDSQQVGFSKAAAAVTMRTRLAAGSQIALAEGWDHLGSRGPFAVESRPRRQRHFLCAVGLGHVRVPYTAIEWCKTAEANGVTVPGPVLMNRVGPVLEPAPV
jgi:hypothetical protein